MNVNAYFLVKIRKNIISWSAVEFSQGGRGCVCVWGGGGGGGGRGGDGGVGGNDKG